MLEEQCIEAIEPPPPYSIQGALEPSGDKRHSTRTKGIEERTSTANNASYRSLDALQVGPHPELAEAIVSLGGVRATCGVWRVEGEFDQLGGEQAVKVDRGEQVLIAVGKHDRDPSA
jgi:hypothetical protein